MRFKTTENNQSVETTRHGPVVNVMTDTLATAQNYCLRNMPHNRQLPDRISPITDCNFGNRALRTRDISLLGHFGTVQTCGSDISAPVPNCPGTLRHSDPTNCLGSDVSVSRNFTDRMLYRNMY